MEVLIMGGTQFVSSSLAIHLINQGFKVDIFTRGKIKVDYDGIRNHIIGDRKSIIDLKILKDRSYEIVFDISAYTQRDIELLISVLDRSKLQKYVFCSSGGVYKDFKIKIREEYPRGYNKDCGDYGLNKMKAEDYLIYLYKNENFPIVIFRPTYIYGERNNIYRETYFFDRITKGLNIPIPAGDNRNHYIYIKDLVKVFESSIYSDKATGNAYNLTHPEEVSWKYLVETAMKIIGKEIEIKKIYYKKLGVDVWDFFPFSNVTYLLSIEKLKKDGLYIPNINLKEGLYKTYKWYCKEKPEIENYRMDKIDYVLNC